MDRSRTLEDPGAALPWVVTLDQRGATDTSTVGAKAAALAAATAAGLPVEPGVVLTTSGVARWRDEAVRHELRGAWRSLSHDGADAVIVRSSSTVEDAERSSMAGVFRSILDVRGFDEVCEAIEDIVGHAAQRSDAPFAVLIQPMVDALVGGVLFGADPITGRTDRTVVAAVAGGPDVLVRGAEHGARYVLGRMSRVIERDAPIDLLARSELRSLARLARRARDLFGSPQDIEWAIDRDGELRLLQSRPITTLPTRTSGPHYGPGPVAETFPDRLHVLEADLWVPPLDEGVRDALDIAGAPGARRRRRRNGTDEAHAVLALDGWVVADLDALSPPTTRARRLLDPRVGFRRLRSAWRTGRLRALMPQRAASVVELVDRQLAVVPPLGELDDDALVELLVRSRDVLRALHANEVLCGVALRDNGSASAGASTALAALARGREMGRSDEAIVATDPAVLALVPPRIGPHTTLPSVAHSARPDGTRPSTDARGRGVDDALAAGREQLRMRARWVHELTARVAHELGSRLSTVGLLPSPYAIRDVHLDELRRAIAESRAPRREPNGRTIGSVPARFVLDDAGRPVAVATRRRRGGGEGQGAGGGRAVGTVVDRDDVRPGGVLVVPTLDPDLAPVLPGLAALVAETGSVLSHLAILAREYGVATVVGVPDATRRWPPGTVVAVDGVAGSVSTVDDASAPADARAVA